MTEGEMRRILDDTFVGKWIFSKIAGCRFDIVRFITSVGVEHNMVLVMGNAGIRGVGPDDDYTPWRICHIPLDKVLHGDGHSYVSDIGTEIRIRGGHWV